MYTQKRLFSGLGLLLLAALYPQDGVSDCSLLCILLVIIAQPL